jgi:four helix bundle protein
MQLTEPTKSLRSREHAFTGRSSAWIERTVRDREVASSNLVAPIFSAAGRKNQSSRAEKVVRRPEKAHRCSTAVYSLLSTFLPNTLTDQRERVVAFNFEKLIVYQKAVDFAVVICDRTERFERGYGFLADQLNRAALSISNNIAEVNGRFTKADRRHFFGISRGSVQECVPMLELARRRRLITDEDHASLKARLEEIARMLSGLINGLNNRET